MTCAGGLTEPAPTRNFVITRATQISELKAPSRSVTTPRANCQERNALPREGTAALPYAEFCTFKAIQPAKQRDAGWNVEWACLKAYPRKHYDTRRQNVRRHRHVRGTSTPRAHSNSIHRKSFKMRYHRQTKRPSPTRSSSTRPKPKQPNQPSNASALI